MRFTTRLLLAAAVLVAPVSAALPEDASDLPFEAQFAPFEALPDAPEPTGNAVDLDTIEPPVEVAPEPEAQPAAQSLGTGVASYYGRKFHGRRTASGERFDMNGMTAAHKTLPFGTKLRVTNPSNGESVVVRVNDRGPFTPGRTLDLSRAAASEIGIVQRGHGRVNLERLD